MRYVTVHVTQEDIDNGVRSSGYACPIARRLHADGWREAIVFTHYWKPRELGRPYQMLSARARSFIRRFDNGRPVQPATFRLPLP